MCVRVHVAVIERCAQVLFHSGFSDNMDTLVSSAGMLSDSESLAEEHCGLHLPAALMKGQVAVM